MVYNGTSYILKYLKWMIWGYPYFRKPLYDFKKDLGQTGVPAILKLRVKEFDPFHILMWSFPESWGYPIYHPF